MHLQPVKLPNILLKKVPNISNLPDELKRFTIITTPKINSQIPGIQSKYPITFKLQK